MAGFKIEVTVEIGDLSFEPPFVDIGTYNGNIYWGDTNVSNITAYNDPDRIHNYASPGSYEVEFIGSFPGWSFNNSGDKNKVTKIIYQGDSVDFDGWQLFDLYGCSNLESLGSGSILSDGLVLLTNSFRSIGNNTNGVVIPSGIFDGLSSVTNISSLFVSTKLDGSLPSGLLDSFVNVTNLARCFQAATGLAGDIPSRFFAELTSATFWNYAFYLVSSVRIPSDLWYSDGEKSTRFLNKSSNFFHCFDGCGTDYSDNVVPDLWNCDFGIATPQHDNWIDGHSASTLANWKNIPVDWGGPAVPPPTINSISDNTIVDKQDLLLNTDDTLPFQYNGKVELCNNQDYSTSSVFVEQTINYAGWSDTQIGIEINRGTLDLGEAYLFITTDRGDRNALGFPVIIISNIVDLANNPVINGTSKQFIGYIEPESTPETLSLKMYNFLLYSIRQADSTREGAFFVKRLFEGPQAVWQKTHDKIFSIKNLWSITTCPDEALKFLKWIVGWTSELDYVTDELDNDTLRKLISTSVPLWRKRGIEETTLDILTIVANARCLIWNWFDYRWIIDETEFGENHQGRDSWIIDNPGEPDFGEYYSTLRIVDDSTLNRTLVKNIVKLMRPCGERMEIAYIDFLDRFLVEGDTSQWETPSGSSIVAENGHGVLNDSAYQLAVVTAGDAAVWTRYVFYCRIKGIGTGNSYGVVFYYLDTDNYYELVLNIDSVSDDYVLNKIVGGSSTLVTSGTISQKILDDVWYGVRIHIDVESGSNRIKLYIDGSEIFNILDSSTLDSGTIGFFSSASTTSELDECELFQLPLVTELVDINS
jgi:hypothetical protein